SQSKSKSSLPLSTTEWIPSENSAELPLAAAAMNLVTAIARFAPNAPYTATGAALVPLFDIVQQAYPARTAGRGPEVRPGGLYQPVSAAVSDPVSELRR